MVDAPRTELDREGNGARLRELIPVEPQREPRGARRLQIPSRLTSIERSPLQEHVRRLRGHGSLRQHLGDREVQVLVG